MGIEINAGVILQVVIAAVLVGVGKVVYQTSLNVATLAQELTDHTKQDAINFAALLKQGRAAKTRSNRKRTRK